MARTVWQRPVGEDAHGKQVFEAEGRGEIELIAGVEPDRDRVHARGVSFQAFVVEPSGAYGMPKRRSNQRWTRAWLRTSIRSGDSGKAARTRRITWSSASQDRLDPSKYAMSQSLTP